MAAGWTGQLVEPGCWQDRAASEEARLVEEGGGLDMAAGPTGQLAKQGGWQDLAAGGTAQSRLAGWGLGGEHEWGDGWEGDGDCGETGRLEGGGIQDRAAGGT